MVIVVAVELRRFVRDDSPAVRSTPVGALEGASNTRRSSEPGSRRQLAIAGRRQLAAAAHFY